MSTDYEKLAAHFDRTFKKPPHGLEYLTGEQVITRLNRELGFDGWSFVIRQQGADEESDSVWVLGELTVILEDRVITKQQFGSQAHNRTRDSHKIIDFGFDLKAAATDALKKCATLIGVGLYLSEKEGGQDAQKAVQAPQKVEKPPTPTKTQWDVYLEMGFTRDFVIAESQRLFDNREPPKLTADEKRRLTLHLTELSKKEPVHA